MQRLFKYVTETIKNFTFKTKQFKNSQTDGVANKIIYSS